MKNLKLLITILLPLAGTMLFHAPVQASSPVASNDGVDDAYGPDTVVIACDSFKWRNNTYRVTTHNNIGDYCEVVGPSAAGGDSIVCLDLTLYNTKRDVYDEIIGCDSVVFNATVYRASTYINDTIHGVVHGICDSLASVSIQINPSYESFIDKSACSSVTYKSHTYTANTEFDENMTTTKGCDSIVHVEITILTAYRDTIYPHGCGSFFDSITNQRYYSSRVIGPIMMGNTVDGCDSLKVIILTIHPTTSYGEQYTTVCDSMVWGNQIFYEDTVGPKRTIKTKYGCDSIVTLTLFVRYAATADTNAIVCDSISWYGRTYFGGNPKHIFREVTHYGCDSILTLNLTMLHGSHRDTVVHCCDSFEWRGNTYYTSTNDRTPFKQYVNTQGCDSAIHLYLSVHYTTFGDTVSRECDSTIWHGNRFYEDGDDFTYAYINSNGCDSIVTLHVRLRHNSVSYDTAKACGNLIWRYHQYFETGTYYDTLINRAGCDSILTLFLTINPQGEGSLTGMFEIDNDRYVSFSQGNLQYLGSENKWRFAEHQYDYVGQTNRFADSTFNQWIDLFGWATSGYHNPSDRLNTNFEPYDTLNVTIDEEYNSKGYGPSTNMTDLDLTGVSSNYDWGTYNAIANGGRAAGMWRTLTDQEWNHLVYYRRHAMQKRALATVYGLAGSGEVRGAVLLPDSWYLPDNCTFNPGSENGFLTNYYNNEQWQSMHNAGAIFLPAAGNRFTSIVSGQEEYGYYWTSSHYDAESAHLLVITRSHILIDPYPRHIGRSVRLAQDVNGHSLPCTTYGDTVIRVDSLLVWYGEEMRQSGDYQRISPSVNHQGCDSIVTIHLTVKSDVSIANVMLPNLHIFSRGHSIVVDGNENMPISVYDLQGRLLEENNNGSVQHIFETPAMGIYMVKVGHLPARKVVVTY